MTDYLLSHQLLPEALGRGELVAGLVMLPWILLWWLFEWLLVRSCDPSAGTGSLCNLSFPQRGLQVHLCVHSPGAFSPRIILRNVLLGRAFSLQSVPPASMEITEEPSEDFPGAVG